MCSSLGKTICFLHLLVFFSFISVSFGAESDFYFDTSRYIPLDEVKPGMKAYCLTVYKGTKIEKFDLEVISVVKDIDPSRNAILVMGKDERFIYTGPVAGCSGSPVYIEGRLAGALSFGWSLSKDPLYGVTPIEEMVRPTRKSSQPSSKIQYSFDFSQPIDLLNIDQQIKSHNLIKHQANSNIIPCALSGSGIPQSAGEHFNQLADSLGLYAALSGGANLLDTAANVQLEPGAPLAMPLLMGDIRIAAIGTVTDVVGNDVYAFGHGFLGYGAVDLPMGTAQVHTVVSSIMRSFKLASALEAVGSVQFDEATVVRGKIGEKARTIPLTITVERFNDPQMRTYNCIMADNDILTPLLLRIALNGAAEQYGDLPPKHSIKYKTDIRFNNGQSLSFDNVSSDSDLQELIVENVVPVAMLMNNPFKDVKIDSINCSMQQYDKSIVSQIWSLNLSHSQVKPGQKVLIDVGIESIRSPKKKYTFELEIPQNLKNDKYEVIICGGYGYLEFLRKTAEQRFIASDMKSLTDALNLILNIRRDRLYCIFMLPKGGINLDRAELPDLPDTKSLIMIDAKRMLNVSAYQHWIEKSIPIETIVLDSQKLEITVAD